MSIEKYQLEFKSLEKLVIQYKRMQMTPCVDDDFPGVKWDYDHAVWEFLLACKNNGRKAGNEW